MILKLASLIVVSIRADGVDDNAAFFNPESERVARVRVYGDLVEEIIIDRGG